MTARVVWILNHYAVEPGGVGPTRHQDLARHLPDHGWQACLIAASVEHSTGRQRLAAGEPFRLERHDAVLLLWVRTPTYRGNGLDRIFNMLAYAWQVQRRSRTRDLPRPDVIVGSSLHPLAAWAGARLATRHRVPFVYEFRDLWPHTLVAMGRIGDNGLVAKGLRRLDRYLVRRAARIVSPLPGGDRHVRELGADVARFTWIPNGVALGAYEPVPAAESDQFTLMYLGAHGEANDLDTLLGAMCRLHRAGHPVRLRLVGDGPHKPRLMAAAAENHLHTVQFEDPVPKSAIPEVAAGADAFVICVRDLPGLYRYGVCMNKLADYMALARPTIVAMDALNNPIEDCDGGLSVPPEDPEALAIAIESLRATSLDSRRAMGERAREYARRHLDTSVLARRLAEVLDAAIKPTGRGNELAQTDV